MKGGVIEWKELISQKRDKEKKSMDSEKEWKLLTEEMFKKEEEQKEETD